MPSNVELTFDREAGDKLYVCFRFAQPIKNQIDTEKCQQVAVLYSSVVGTSLSQRKIN